MPPNTISSVKTCVLRIRNPSKRKRAILEDALQRYHFAYSKALNDILENIESYAGLTKQSRKEKLTRRIFDIVIPIRSLSASAKDGISEDLAQQIESYIELRKVQKRCSVPAANSLDPTRAVWESILDDLVASNSRAEFIQNRERLLSQAKGGVERPVLFPRYAKDKGFVILNNPAKGSYAVWLNLHPAKYSRFAERVEINDMIDIRTGKPERIKSSTGAIFPIELGADYQISKFFDQVPAERDGKQYFGGSPQTAKLVKKVDSLGTRFEIHVAFVFKSAAITKRSYLGVDRGISSFLGLSVTSPDGAVLYRETISGVSLNRHQRIAGQKNGRKCSPHTRRALADETVHAAANRIVKIALEHGSQVILENAHDPIKSRKTGYRTNFNRITTRALYAKLEKYLTYKLKTAGLPAPKSVISAGTSHTCHCCGHRSNENRPRPTEKGRFDVSRFLCVHCGQEDDVDLNTATVIAQRYIWRKQLPASHLEVPWALLPDDVSFTHFVRNSCRKV